MRPRSRLVVILAQAGIQKLRTRVTETLRLWIPAFAGMTR